MPVKLDSPATALEYYSWLRVYCDELAALEAAGPYPTPAPGAPYPPCDTIAPRRSS